MNCNRYLDFIFIIFPKLHVLIRPSIRLERSLHIGHDRIQVLRKLCSYSFLPFLPLLLLSLLFCLFFRPSLFSEAGCVFFFLPDIFLIIFKTGTAPVCTYDYHILRTVIAVQDQFQMFLFNTEYIAATLYKQMAFFRFSCLTSRKIQTVL